MIDTLKAIDYSDGIVFDAARGGFDQGTALWVLKRGLYRWVTFAPIGYVFHRTRFFAEQF